MQEAYGELEAQTLFCPRCRRAVAVRKKLLLILPTGTKYDYVCQVCGAPVGAKLDADPRAFQETTRAAIAAARHVPGARGPTPGGGPQSRPARP